MPVNRMKIVMLLCGLIIATATQLCHAHEPGKLFDVKLPQAEVSPAFVPDITSTPVPKSADVKPAGEAWDHPWYVLILEWLAMDIARHNTEKQNDGRPNPLPNLR